MTTGLRLFPALPDSRPASYQDHSLEDDQVKMLTQVGQRAHLRAQIKLSLTNLLSEKETNKLLLEPDITTPLGIRNRAIIELLYATGVRNSELREMLLGEIDLDRKELFVAKGKGGKSRRLPLGEEAAACLEDYLSNSRPYLAGPTSGEVVFLSCGGHKLTRGKLSLMVREVAEACGLDKLVTPHLLRHACATHMLRRGAGIRQLQVLLGHSELSTTQRYTRIEIGDLHKVVSQFHPRERGFDGEA